MKKIYIIFVILTFSYIHLSCQKNAKKDINNPLKPLFADDFKKSPVALFSMLNEYPALKNAFSKLDPLDFNRRLNTAISPIDRNVLANGMDAASALLSQDEALRNSTKRISTILYRLRTGNPKAYNSIMGYLERIRKLPRPVIQAVLPITHDMIHEQTLKPAFCMELTRDTLTKLRADSVPDTIITKLDVLVDNKCRVKENLSKDLITVLGETDKVKYEESIYKYTSQYDEIIHTLEVLVSNLEKQGVKDLVKGLDEVMYKATYSNPNAKQGFTEVLQSITDETVASDRVLKNKIIEIIGVAGDLMNKKAGFQNTKSAETIIKEAIYNLQNFYSTAGKEYLANDAYRNPDFPAEFSKYIGESMQYVRKLFNNDLTLVKDPSKTIIQILLDNLASFDTADSELIDSTLQRLVALDFKGKDRSTDSTSIDATALESLIFVLALTDIFGYQWNDSTSKPQITGMTDGAITIGDSLTSLRSRMVGGVVGMAQFLKDSYTAANNGDVQKDGANFPVGINTKALCLLQGEAKGDISGCDDPTYTKTIPWAMGMISRVLFEGYGPYYNKNRTSGQLSLANSKYKTSWKTSEFKIKVKDGSFAGLGGTQNPAGNGSSYTITEIAKTDAERAVNSDEEAIYKNFMWLVHEKRMALVIPVNAIMSNGTVKEATYITVVGNGLSGLMNAKPCNDLNTSCSLTDDNGKWRKKGVFIKTPTTVGGLTTAGATVGDFQTFSDTPGDSVLLVEAWGNGMTGLSAYSSSEGLFPILWDLAFTQNAAPFTFYGAIPAVVAVNFSIFERLGFLTDAVVKPADINPEDTSSKSYWKKRNKLLPVVAALAKSLKEQVDTTKGREKNTFQILTGLARILVRPYIYKGTDWIGDVGNGYAGGLESGKTILTLRISTVSPDDGIRSPFMLEQNYYPNAKYRTLLSLLAEGHVVKSSTPNGRRYQDGIINLLSQTKLASSVAGLFNEFNLPSRKQGKDKMISGLSKIIGEIKITSEKPAENQFDIEAAMLYLSNQIRDYTTDKTPPNYNSTRTFDSTWNGVNDVVQLVRDLFTVNSKYSIIRNIDNLFDIIIDSKPTQEETASLVEILSSLFTSESGQASYLISGLLSEDTPKLARAAIPYSRSLLTMTDKLTETGGFLGYMQDIMSSDYSIAATLYDLERFLNSSMVTTTARDDSSLFYSSGLIMKQMGDVLRRGKKFDTPGYYFKDSANSGENNVTAFDVFNYIFCNK